MYVLDTNVVSEIRKRRPALEVVRWLASNPQEQLFTSVIVIEEIEIGVRRMERSDPLRGARMRTWLAEQVMPWFGDRMLLVDLATATRAAGFHVPDPSERHDALIGASAAIHGFAVVTRNVRDFERFGVPTINPWEVT